MALTTGKITLAERVALADKLQQDQGSQDLRQLLEQFRGRPVNIVYENAKGEVIRHPKLVLSDIWTERGLQASKELPYNNVIFSFGNGTQLALVTGSNRSLPSRLPGTRGRLMRVETTGY